MQSALFLDSDYTAGINTSWFKRESFSWFIWRIPCRRVRHIFALCLSGSRRGNPPCSISSILLFFLVPRHAYQHDKCKQACEIQIPPPLRPPFLWDCEVRWRVLHIYFFQVPISPDPLLLMGFLPFLICRTHILDRWPSNVIHQNKNQLKGRISLYIITLVILLVNLSFLLVAHLLGRRRDGFLMASRRRRNSRRLFWEGGD